MYQQSETYVLFDLAVSLPGVCLTEIIIGQSKNVVIRVFTAIFFRIWGEKKRKEIT